MNESILRRFAARMTERRPSPRLKPGATDPSPLSRRRAALVEARS
jgi:hypothetical protein